MARGRGFALFVLAWLCGGCAEPPIAAGNPKTANLDLAPYTIREDCAELGEGDRLDYRFESNAPLKFNIYYRDSNMIVEPITHEGITSDSAVFSPRIPARYCLSWEAGPMGALVSYRVNIRRGSIR